jgi:hypothetical protein
MFQKTPPRAECKETFDIFIQRKINDGAGDKFKRVPILRESDVCGKRKQKRNLKI